MRLFVLLPIFILSLSAQAEIQFQVKGSAQEKGLIEAQQGMLSYLIPIKVQNAIARKPIKIEIKDLETAGNTTPGKPNSINIARKILGDKNLLQRTLIHEMMHLYDYAHVTSPSMGARIEECRQIIEKNASSTKYGDVPADCIHLADFKYSVSDDPAFLRAAFWPKTGFLGSSRYQRGNYAFNRSPDQHEFKNEKEAFAVNFEFFVLDPEFKCRRPSLYNYFSQRFNMSPFEDVGCSSVNSVLVSGGSISGGLSNIEKIDFNRVYSIHYLFAGAGQEMMSKYGHAMIRLVICAPHRKELNEECVKDISYHRVVSFRASVEDFTIDGWKGLTGYYPSILFILPLNGVIDEYTRREMREVVSYPLKLDRPQIYQFLTAMMEMHWSYEGRYYFFGNNCAVETLNLFKLALPELFIEVEKTKTPAMPAPDSLRDELLKFNIIDDSQQKDQKQAVANGYYFQSKAYLLDVAVKQLQEDVPELKTMKLAEILNIGAQTRSQYFQNIKNPSKKTLAAFLAIEEQAYLKLVNIVFKEAIAAAQNNTDVANESSVKMKQDLGAARKMMSLFSSPGGLFAENSGYGIPSLAELETLMNNVELQEDTKNSEQIRKDISDKMSNIVSTGLSAELKASGEFRKSLSDSLKAIILQSLKK